MKDCDFLDISRPLWYETSKGYQEITHGAFGGRRRAISPAGVCCSVSQGARGASLRQLSNHREQRR